MAGAFVQGTPDERFFYIDTGTYAGQQDLGLSRRLKSRSEASPLQMIPSALLDPTLVFETVVPGVGKDGGPNCATIKPFAGWQLNCGQKKNVYGFDGYFFYSSKSIKFPEKCIF